MAVLMGIETALDHDKLTIEQPHLVRNGPTEI